MSSASNGGERKDEIVREWMDVFAEMRQIADHIDEIFPASASDLREDALYLEEQLEKLEAENLRLAGEMPVLPQPIYDPAMKDRAEAAERRVRKLEDRLVHLGIPVPPPDC